MGLDDDLPPGEQLVACFPTFPRTSGDLGKIKEDNPRTRG
jgi:hypothetical protein